MFIKICGITRLADALHAAEHGATAVGFVFWPKSPRHVALEQAAEIIAALPASVTPVGVFVNETVDGIRGIVERTGIAAVQLHGDEAPAYARELGWPVLRAITVDDAETACPQWPRETTFLVDAADPVRRGGTGSSIDWTKAASLARRCRLVLAGGLDPANVQDAIGRVRPFGVDVSSGVEDAPGVKSREKMTRFLESARSALEQQ
jgi:phosphoribosylanthranilate isomerase